MPEKIANATAVDKALNLYDLLMFTDKEYSALELTQILQCSKSTVSRLLHQLETREGPALNRRNDGGREWYSINCPVELKEPPATKKSGSGKNAQASSQAAQLCTADLRFAPSPAVDYTEQAGCLSAILRAIGEKQFCSVTYRTKDAEKVWELAPARLLTASAGLFLEAWLVSDSKRPQRVLLAVQRISNVTPLDKKHSIKTPDGISPRFGVLSGKAFPVRVRFDKQAAAMAADRHYSKDEQFTLASDGSLTVSFTAASKAEVLNWILGFGSHAEILEPQGLRKDLLTELDNAIGLYEKGEA